MNHGVSPIYKVDQFFKIKPGCMCWQWNIIFNTGTELENLACVVHTTM